MKLTTLLLCALVVTAVLEVTARKGGKQKPGRPRRGRGRPKRPRPSPSQRQMSIPVVGRSSWGNLFDSLISGIDDGSVVVDLGRWGEVISVGDDNNNNNNNNMQTTTAPEPAHGSSGSELPLPYSGEWIRLRATSSFANAGIVEVFRAGRWGLVCDDGWDMKAANVACRQLGFTQGASDWSGSAKYGLIPGRWDNSDILMDDVDCDGSEDSLQRCHYNDRHDCQVSEAAGVVCKANRECPENWIGGSDSCYQFLGGEISIKAASARCESLNASLASVESVQENNFLSNILSLTGGKTEHIWYTSGRLTKRGWLWTRKVERRVRSQKKSKRRRGKGKGKGKGKKGKNRRRGAKKGRKSRSQARTVRSVARRRMRNVRSLIETSRWFPGWEGSGVGQEPIQKKGHTCLVLTDMFPLPNGTDVPVDYFYWKASRCKQKNRQITFICEKPAPPLPKECYTGNGIDYRGVMDQTDKGTPCISWSLSSVTNDTHPGKGLGDHNYCRNPDSDQRPWCWVARGKFGYCPIPLCSATTAIPPTTTSAPEPESLNCPHNQFFCEVENICIPGSYRCDGEEDCQNAEDEAGCEYNVGMFEEYGDKIPAQRLANVSYQNTPLETCATYCVDNKHFMCVAFVYKAQERLCQLLDAADNSTVHLLPAEGFSYYLLRSEAVDCTGKFRCNNDRCIDAVKKCNGRDDCGDQSDELACATQPPPMTVRLAGGEENSGRVEVHYLGEWGIVCDDNWDIDDAHVVCRMLGYPQALRASVAGEFGTGEGNIMLDEVECAGTEDSLQACPASPWKQHDCQPFESAGVECQMEKTCGYTQHRCKSASTLTCVHPTEVCNGVPNCPDSSDEADCELKVELVNGTAPSQGRVELVRNGLRGTICDDDWDNGEAAVVCRMLGYSHGGMAIAGGNQFAGGQGVIWMDNVECSGTESSLADCAHQGWTVNDCSHLEDAGVVCYTSPPTTTTTTTTEAPSRDSVVVHLMNGATPNQGLVVLEVSRYRGTICDDSFDDNDAIVICRMAGFRYGGRAVTDGSYGVGNDSMPILLDNLGCSGLETNVLDCLGQPLGSHNCQHSEDVGVFCLMPDTSGGDGGAQPQTTSSPTTRRPSTSGGVQCGQRPIEHLNRRRRRAANDSDLTALREVEPPRHEKIVGGDLAQHGMYPWQVSVSKIYNIYPNGEMMVGHWCGATIINEFWVLSAAHCFTDLSKSRLLLKVGDHGQKVEDRGEQRFRVEELVMHPNYRRSNHDKDIALLKVKSTNGQGIKFNDYVQPACLPSPSTPYTAGTVCYISGWGETGNGSPKNLRVAKVPLLSTNTCQYLYKRSLTRYMLCAGYLAGGIDTCQGDSGGPLACEIDGAFTLLGITSWGFGCAQPNSPGVYAKTQEFLTWIEDVISRDSASP